MNLRIDSQSAPSAFDGFNQEEKIFERHRPERLCLKELSLVRQRSEGAWLQNRER